MALPVLFRGILKGSTTVEQQVAASKRGSLFIQKDMPDYAQLVKDNKVWSVTQTTATAAVIGSTFPTTACQVALYNNESEGSGKIYVIIAVGAVQIAAGAALAAWGIIYGVSQIKQTTLPTADIAAASIRPMKGNGGAYPGRALVDLAPTLNVDPLYKPLPFGNSVNNPVNSLAGPMVSSAVHGLIVLPPSSLLALHVVAADTGVTTLLSCIWAELDNDEF